MCLLPSCGVGGTAPQRARKKQRQRAWSVLTACHCLHTRDVLPTTPCHPTSLEYPALFNQSNNEDVGGATHLKMMSKISSDSATSICPSPFRQKSKINK
jgi:hypothetical protein